MTRLCAVLLILSFFTAPLALAADHGGPPVNPVSVVLNSVWSFFDGILSWFFTTEESGAMIIPNGITEGSSGDGDPLLSPKGGEQNPDMDASGAMIIPNG